jgi:hypothetical protein
MQILPETNHFDFFYYKTIKEFIADENGTKISGISNLTDIGSCEDHDLQS